MPAESQVPPGWSTRNSCRMPASRSNADRGSSPRGATAISPRSRSVPAASTAEASAASWSGSAPEPEPEPAPRPQPYRITTLHPRTYNEARTIGENFREGVPVIMNLSEMDDNDAKRLVDFSAGLVFAVRGTIERVTNKVFLLSPPNVSVAAEDKARIAEGGFFNQS